MTPDLRQSVAAFALIRRQRRGRPEWLAQWNPNWQSYNFVGGHKRNEETFRECVAREISEELQLQEHREFTVSRERAARLEYVDFSESAHEETAYTIELFEVRLSRIAMLRWIPAQDVNRWLTANEVIERATRDGRPIGRSMGRILERAGAVSGRSHARRASEDPS
jgi:ADP-ribose pyrophosphatase YjhB (NUDIX family)